MLTTVYFDTPPVITPAVTAAFRPLGGLDLDNPQVGYRECTGYDIKAPRELTLADVLMIAEEVAQLHNVGVDLPADPSSFEQVLQAVRQVTERVGRQEPGFCQHEQSFDLATANTDDLVYGLLTLSFDGNNITNVAEMRMSPGNPA